MQEPGKDDHDPLDHAVRPILQLDYRQKTRAPTEEERQRWRARAHEIWTDERRYGRLYAYARACVTRLQQWPGMELDVDADELLQRAAVVMLECRLTWHPEIDRTVDSLLTVIHNESRNLEKYQRRRSHPDWRARAVRPSSQDTRYGQDVRIDVHASIDGLSPARKNAVEAIWLRDQNPAEYAATNGISAKTARNQLHQAKTCLRSALADYQ